MLLLNSIDPNIIIFTAFNTVPLKVLVDVLMANKMLTLIKGYEKLHLDGENLSTVTRFTTSYVPSSLSRIAKTTVLRLDAPWLLLAVSAPLCLAGAFRSGGMVSTKVNNALLN